MTARRPGSTRKRRSDAVPKPDEKTLADMQSMSAIGYSISDIANSIGVNKDVIDAWRKRYPTVKAAIDKGRALCRKRAYRCYMEQAFPLDIDGRPSKKGDAPLMIFFMKTRFRWKEPERKLQVEATKKDGKLVFQINGQCIAPEQLASTLQGFYDQVPAPTTTPEIEIQ